MSDDFSVEPLNPLRNRFSNLSSNMILKWLGILAVGLFILSIFIFWFGGSSFSESKISFKIDGPTQASVGDEVIYKVIYQNTTKTDLSHLRLTFTYPDGSVILKDGQVDNSPSYIESRDLDILKSGQQHEEEFHLFLVGDRGDIKVAKAKLVFDAGRLKSTFEKTADLSTTITNVPVSLTLSAPPSAAPGQTIVYTLDYRNQSEGQIPDLQLVFEYPEGFTPTQFSPSPSQGKNIWRLPILQKNQGGRIRVTGTLNGKEGDAKAVVVTLQRNINTSYIDYVKATTTTVLSSPLLSVALNVNDSSDYISHAGDTLQYSLNYQNNSSYTLNGLTLKVHLDGAMFDFSTVDPRGGFFDPTDHTITWNSTVVSAFDNLRSHQTGSVVFIIKLKSSSNITGSGGSFVRALAEFGTPNVPTGVDSDAVSTQDELVTKITSQPIFNQLVYYNDTAFGSSGPMPPHVGKETVFTVHWRITNPGNNLNSAKVVGTLPQGVTWKNIVSVGAGQPEPTFNKNTSQVIWNLGMVPSGIGTSNNNYYELAFQVIVKPSSTQINQPVVMVKSAALSGVDSFTQQNIVVSVPDIMTTDTVDRPNEGVVQ